jgi:hydroxymethylglutaryl-CoA lyase
MEGINDSTVQLIECPRDAMQGWKTFIPTRKKIEYINALLQVGFDTIDFGSFVSAKAIPQMADTVDLLEGLEVEKSKTKLLAIIANVRGAEQAAQHNKITYLGFPFSVSSTFQLRNTNSTIEESLKRVKEIQSICLAHNKQLVVYISMGFGNPYGDAYSQKIAFEWVNKITTLGIKIISLADTVGLATAEQVFSMTDYLVRKLPDHEIGVHLHSRPEGWKAKIDAALRAGCKRFDGALKGIGGCPMADDELVGNMDSELLIHYFQEKKILSPLDENALAESLRIANEIFF